MEKTRQRKWRALLEEGGQNQMKKMSHQRGKVDKPFI